MSLDLMQPALLPLKIPARVYSTRFQGSKRRVLPWLLQSLDQVAPSGGKVLDGFAGSGVVSYGLASMGWDVTASDRLLSAGIAVKAFCGGSTPLTEGDLTRLEGLSETSSSGWLNENYAGIHFPENELHWLENATEFIHQELPETKRPVALWAVCQAALAKRPYNMFHRANLDMRTRDVTRSFGNKVTWERPFPQHVRKFAQECAQLMLEREPATVIHSDPLDVEPSDFDLVYLDPPYIDRRGVPTPYNDFYSFLDFICDTSLRSQVDRSRPHLPRLGERTSWERAEGLLNNLKRISDLHPGAVIALSYRTDSTPTIEEAVSALESCRSEVHVLTTPIKYALSKTSQTKEALIVGRG